MRNQSSFSHQSLPNEKRLEIRATLKNLRGEKFANAFADKPFGETSQITFWINNNACPALKSEEWTKVLDIINN
jgi:hypothetical protein